MARTRKTSSTTAIAKESNAIAGLQSSDLIPSAVPSLSGIETTVEALAIAKTDSASIGGAIASTQNADNILALSQEGHFGGVLPCTEAEAEAKIVRYGEARNAIRVATEGERLKQAALGYQKQQLKTAEKGYQVIEQAFVTADARNAAQHAGFMTGEKETERGWSRVKQTAKTASAKASATDFSNKVKARYGHREEYSGDMTRIDAAMNQAAAIAGLGNQDPI